MAEVNHNHQKKRNQHNQHITNTQNNHSAGSDF